MHTSAFALRRHGAALLGLILGLALGAQAQAQTPGAVSSLDDLEGTHGHAAAPAAGAEIDDTVDCQAEGPCVETATGLPLRVLPRPFSNAYQSPVANADALVIANLPAFQPLYVFDREGVDLSRGEEPAGWYQVGRSSAAAEGWMQARDVFEWRQALLVSYTHPGDPIEGRHPVLMFRELTALEELIDDVDMPGRARALYAAIDGGEVPAELVSMEPQRFVDITRQFYLLPILQWRETRIMGDDLRMLQLAAAVPGARGPDTLASADYRAQAQVARDGATAGTVPDLNVDVVFVIDTTRSMQPFIDMTREAVIGMTNRLAEDAERRFRFGLVTFRDSTEVIPQIEYVTRVHTPKLIDARSLVDRLEQARATEVGSLDYAEEVFAGVDVAMRSSWREGALRLMILIGDASSHPKGHRQNVTGKDEVDLRRELDDAQIHLLAIHLQDPRATEDHPIALAQRARLARVRGTQDTAALEEVDAFDEQAYRALADRIIDRIRYNLLSATGATADAAADPGVEEVESVDRLWQAALIEYLGRDAEPPKDIVAWVSDRDLVHPADRALDVRVLVTRQQLNALALALEQVVQALMRAEVTQAQFFESLQSVAGQTMKRPEDIAGSQRLADTGLLPAFIQSLPYRSDILSLTDEMFASMTTEQRSQLEWSILAKLEQYRAINEQVDAWFRLNEADSDADMVYPLHLDYLP